MCDGVSPLIRSEDERLSLAKELRRAKEKRRKQVEQLRKDAHSAKFHSNDLLRQELERQLRAELAEEKQRDLEHARQLSILAASSTVFFKGDA